MRSKTRPKQVDERGDYAPVAAQASNVKRERLTAVVYVVALLLVAVGFILAHHFFCAFLNEKSINSESKGLSSFLRDQNSVNFIGTSIAHGVRIVLSIAAGATFVQLFWDALRSRTVTIEQVDALVRCGKSPFNLSTPRAASASFLAVVTSLVASALALVVILAPGSLTIATDVQRTSSCEVFTLPSAVDSNCTSIGISLAATSTNVLASNTYAPPLLLDRGAACGAGASTCSYNVSFHGPAFDCADATNQTDFSQLIHPTQPPPPIGAPFVIWNVSGTEGSILALDILTQDLARGVVRATTCTAHNATYDALITSFDGSSSPATVQVQNVSLHSPLESLDEMPFLNSYALDAIDNLEGIIYGGPNGFIGGATDDPIQTSQIFGTTAVGNLTFNDDIIHFFTSYMQNVSISLLSGNVYYCLSNDTETNLQRVDATCDSTFSVYVYDSTRLLTTYGAALGVVLLVAVMGCWLILRDGKEERLLFSQIVRISLNEELFRASHKLEPNTPLRLERTSSEDPMGRLIPVSAESWSEALLTSSSEAEKYAQEDIFTKNASLSSRSWKGLTSLQGRSALFVLLTLVCMVLQHSYYRYLNGKTPISRLRLSDSRWILDQTVVSDVGIALAYIAQTLLAIAIILACTQRFWWTIRSRARSVSDIDALMNVQSSPFSPSTFRALRASPSVTFLAFLAAAMTLISILAPGSVRVSSNHGELRSCTIATPKNLSALSITENLESLDTIYQTPVMVALASGTYLPPINPCDLGDASECSYNIRFVGPGFECQDVMATSNETAFTTPEMDGGINATNLFGASIMPQDESLTMNMSVQTWDTENSIYTASRCGGILRSYTAVISHSNTSSSIDVTESRVEAAIHANISQLSSFPEVYLFDIMSALKNAVIVKDNTPDDPVQGIISITSAMGNLFTIQLDGNITWNRDMPNALETFAQNAALGVLSGQIFAFNPNDPSLLENSTSSCAYFSTAYEYRPSLLFSTYGVATFFAVLSVVWGGIAVRLNGGEESMDFSRFLRAVLNPRLLSVSDRLDAETTLRATPGVQGVLIPSI